MPNPNEGGSVDPNEEVLFNAEFPKNGGGTVNNEVPNGEIPNNPNPEQHAAPKNDPVQPAQEKDDGKNNHPDGSQHNSEQPSLTPQEQELRNKQLDLIESYMKQGVEAARKFFNENPEYAVIANRSKRLKEAYRSFIENPATPGEAPAQPAEAPKPKEKVEVQDVDSVADKVYMKNLKREEASMQNMEARSFAEKKGLNVDHFDSLLESAQNLQKVTGQPFSQCLEGAYLTINGKASAKKPSLPSGGGAPKNGAAEVPEKETEIERLMGHGYTRETAEKYYKSKYQNTSPDNQFTGKLGERFRVN